jgi:hypothetical protein
MSGHVNASIFDPESGRTALVTEERVLQVINHGHPPKSETLFAIPFRERFKDIADSFDMAVNGSVTEVDFKINAINNKDIYLRSLSVLIGDGGSPALNKFGNLSALTNGVEIVYSTARDGEIIIHEGIKTNLEFIRIGVDTPAIGTGTDAFLADVSGGGTEKSYIPTIDIQETFGLPFGLKLRQGTSDFISFRVRDDLSTITTFNIIGYGIQI